MKPPRWTFTADRASWSLSLGGVVVASSGSQKRAVGDAIRRLVNELNETIDDRDDAELAATRLAAWSATVKGRAGEVTP